MKTLALTLFKRPLFSALMVVGGLLVATGARAEMAGSELLVPINRSELVTVSSDISEVIIANPEIADVYVHGKNKISVVARQVGMTSLRAFDEDMRELTSITVRVTFDLPAIRQALYQFFPYEDIAVQLANNNVVLTGTVSSPAVAQKAVRIANEFMLPTEEERPRQQGFDDLSLSPDSDSSSEGQGADYGVINMMKVTSGQQVMLRVRIGEVQRNALKQLGFNWQAINEGAFALTTGSLLNTLNVLGTTTLVNDTGSVVDLTNPIVMNPAGSQVITSPDGTFGQALAGHSFGSTRVTAMLEALEEHNLFKLMAEPNIVAMSGEEAEFLSGGEFPIPVVTSDTINVEYRSYGVSVRFRPVVLSDSRIRLSVSPEVSELTDLGSIEISNISIPALTTRRARTTVELAPGESFMIAGLIRDQSDSTVQQLPGVGEVPILSALFRKTNFERTETELVIAVTPYLVSPVTGKDIRLPTDGFRPASMMEQFFYGALGSLQGDARKISQTPPLEGPIGFMVD